MKRTFIIIAAMMLTMITASAKKVTVTIDGTVYRTQEKIYLIVDEDTANAVVVPVQNGQFTVTTTVDANSIIRPREPSLLSYPTASTSSLTSTLQQ